MIDNPENRAAVFMLAKSNADPEAYGGQELGIIGDDSGSIWCVPDGPRNGSEFVVLEAGERDEVDPFVLWDIVSAAWEEAWEARQMTEEELEEAQGCHDLHVERDAE